jgi:hypothetical protein
VLLNNDEIISIINISRGGFFMYYQIIGLALDIIGVIMLSLGGVFKIAGFQYGPSRFDYIMLWIARIGLLLAIFGFGFQIYGLIQTYSVLQ